MFWLLLIMLIIKPMAHDPSSPVTRNMTSDASDDTGFTFQSDVDDELTVAAGIIAGISVKRKIKEIDAKEELLKLMELANNTSLGTQIMIMGDFNYPDIDYKNVDHGVGPGTVWRRQISFR